MQECTSRNQIISDFQNYYNFSKYTPNRNARDGEIKEGQIEEVVLTGYIRYHFDSLPYFIFDTDAASPNYGSLMDGGIDIYGGGEGGGDYSDNTNQNDPCSKASPASNNATTNSKTSAYNNAKTAVTGMNNGKENGVVFCNVNGSIQSTGVQTGVTSSNTLTHNFADPVGDLHNHPNNNPPSPGDFYSLISARNQYSNYNSRYIITEDGTTYALVVTDTNAMNTFFKNYPPSITPNPNGGNFVNFAETINNEYNDIYTFYNGTKEMAMSYKLDKYNTGIALTKMDSSGNFKKLGTNETTNFNGEKTYSQNNCQ